MNTNLLLGVSDIDHQHSELFRSFQHLLTPLLKSLKTRYPTIEFDLNVEMTHVLNEQIRRGGLDLVFSAAPVEGTGIVSESLTPMEMILVGPGEMSGMTELSIDSLSGMELMTFQRGSQPHLALLEALRKVGLAQKRVHNISSISALVKLVESGFGLATLPRSAAETLCEGHDIALLRSELKLTPLPLYANYWRNLGIPAVENAIASAMEFTRSKTLGVNVQTS